MDSIRGRAASVLIGLATAFVVVAVVLPLFLNPVWVTFEQGRAQAAAWTGFSESELRAATDSVLADLVIGPPDFDVAVAGTPVLDERERGHMRDVRGVFIGFFAVALVLALAALIVAARRRGAARTRTWNAVRGGAVALVAALAVGGVVSLVAFDTLFEVFHEVFFAGGSYTFDPATERLVQLFPFQFWQETAIVVGAVCVVLAAAVAVIAHGRAEAAVAALGASAGRDGAIVDGTSPSASAAGSPR